MKTLTVDDVTALHLCGRYTREIVEGLFAGRASLTGIDVLNLGTSIEDRMWVLLREDFLTLKQTRLFAADCAEHVLYIWEAKYPEDKRPREAIEAARKFARGEITREQLRVTADAASTAYVTTAAASAAAYASAASATAASATAAYASAARAAYASAAYASAAASAAAYASAASDAASTAYVTTAAASAAAYASAASANYGTSEREWQVERLKEYLAEEEVTHAE